MFYSEKCRQNIRDMIAYTDEEISEERKNARKEIALWKATAQELKRDFDEYKWSDDDHEALTLAPQLLAQIENAENNIWLWTQALFAADCIRLGRKEWPLL